jgi:hypothetical protein
MMIYLKNKEHFKELIPFAKKILEYVKIIK